AGIANGQAVVEIAPSSVYYIEKPALGSTLGYAGRARVGRDPGINTKTYRSFAIFPKSSAIPAGSVISDIELVFYTAVNASEIFLTDIVKVSYQSSNSF